MSSASGLGTSAAAPAATRVNEDVFSDYDFSAFVAMESPVTIVPRFSLQRVDCLGGRYGPFSPNDPVDVPLWLALYLRATDTCTIQPPPYLELRFLRQTLQSERASDSNFEPLPFHFFEIAKALCGAVSANNDIPHPTEVVRLVQDIRAVRERKLRQSMGVFEPEGSAMFVPGIRLTHIICTELHFLRRSFAVVLRQAYEMESRRARPLARMPFVAAGSPSAATTTTTTAASFATTPSASGGGRDTAVSALDETATTALSASPAAAPASAATASTVELAGDASQPLPAPPIKKRRTLRQS